MDSNDLVLTTPHAVLEQGLRVALADRRHAEEALRREVALRQRAEEELRVAREEAKRANRVKTEFLAVMSHELRTPLNAILGYQQLLTEGVAGSITEQQRSHLERINLSSRHLLSLINDVLTVTRLDADKVNYAFETVNLQQALNEVCAQVEPQIAEHRLHLEVIVSAAIAVRADGDKLRQILMNLISNAIKFTPAGGEIRVAAAVSAMNPGMVEIDVIDNGIGIARDEQEAIFDRFVQLDAGRTRSTNGVGLGLTISRELARGQGGSLIVTSDVGRGSTFTLSIPRA